MRLEISSEEAAKIIKEYLIRNKIKLDGDVCIVDDESDASYFSVEIDLFGDV